MKITRLDTVWCPLCSTPDKPVVMARIESKEEDNPHGIVECPICKYSSPILVVTHRGK